MVVCQVTTKYDPDCFHKFSPPAIGYKGKSKPYLRTEQVCGKYDLKGRTRTNCEVWKALGQIPDHRVREAILRNLPKHPRQFVRFLDRFARTIRQMYPNESVGLWHKVVETWHFLARPCGKEWTKEAVQERFAKIHAVSKLGIGERLWKAVRSAGKDIARVLAALSRYLKRRVLFISCRKLAEWTGLSHSTCARRLQHLVASGSIREVAKGQPHVYDRSATTYDVSPLFALSDYCEKPTTTRHRFSSLAGATSPLQTTLAVNREDDLILCLTSTPPALEPTDDPEEDDAFAKAFAEIERLERLRAGPPPKTDG